MKNKYFVIMLNINYIILKRVSYKKKTKKALSLLLITTILSACAPLMGRETMREYVDDASITMSVKNNIVQDSSLKMFQIHVETFQNIVQLSGFVDSKTESRRAEEIAKNIKGVRSVKNNIVIRK